MPSQKSTGKHRGRALGIPTLRLVVICFVAFGLAGCAKSEFKSKYKKIQMDMTEAEVDQLLEGHPVDREELMEAQREGYGPPDGPCKRTPSFRKHYAEKPDAIERDYYIQVYFDQDYLVVHKMLGEYVK
jgi:hypothetical protein